VGCEGGEDGFSTLNLNWPLSLACSWPHSHMTVSLCACTSGVS